MIVWSYLAAVTTDPGRVPPGWHPFLDDQQARHELERMAYSDWPFDRYRRQTLALHRTNTRTQTGTHTVSQGCRGSRKHVRRGSGGAEARMSHTRGLQA